MWFRFHHLTLNSRAKENHSWIDLWSLGFRPELNHILTTKIVILIIGKTIQDWVLLLDRHVMPRCRILLTC